MHYLEWFTRKGFEKQKGFEGLFSLLLIPLFLSSCMGKSRAMREEQDLVIREMRIEIDSLRHKLHDLDSHMELVDGKVNGQIGSFGAMKDEWQSVKTVEQDQLNVRLLDFDQRLTNLEGKHKSMIQDLRQLLTHANDTTASFSQYRKAIDGIEKDLERKEKRLEGKLGEVKQGVASLISMMEGKGKQSSLGRSYLVKDGDSLEKIARKNGTTVEMLKRINHLDSDLIFIGQELSLP